MEAPALDRPLRRHAGFRNRRNPDEPGKLPQPGGKGAEQRALVRQEQETLPPWEPRSVPSVLGNTFDPAHLHRLGSQALGGTRSPCPGADHSARACPQGSRPFLVQEAPPRARLERFWIQVQDLVTASLWKLWKSHTVLQKGYDFGARRSVFTRSRMTSTGICKGGGRICRILKREGEREGECKIPLYNPDSQSNLDEINPQSTQLTQFTLYATRQLSSLTWASLEPMPFGIAASIDAS